MLLSLDATEAVVDEAVREGLNLVVCHHPLLFRGVKRLVGATAVERIVARALQHGIGIYAAHTNMDAAPGGVNFRLAERLGLRQTRVLVPGAVPGVGLGCVGELAEEVPTEQFLDHLTRTLGLPCLRHSAIATDSVRRVAVCGGSGSEFIEAAGAAGAQLYLTADLKYHDFQRAEGRLTLVDGGHFETERQILDVFYELISKKSLILPFIGRPYPPMRWVTGSDNAARNRKSFKEIHNHMATKTKSAAAVEELSTEEKIGVLYALQQIDSKRDSINHIKGELPYEVQDLEDVISGLETRIAGYAAQAEELTREVKTKKEEIEQAKGLIKKYEAQQDDVRNNREFDSLSKEIEYQKLEIELAEKRIKEFNAEVKNKKNRSRRPKSCSKTGRSTWRRNEPNWPESKPIRPRSWKTCKNRPMRHGGRSTSDCCRPTTESERTSGMGWPW